MPDEYVGVYRQGVLLSISQESRVIPRNSREVVGLKVLLGARGTSRSVKRQSSLHREDAHWEEGAGSAMKKSSRICSTLGTLKRLFRIHSRASDSRLKRYGALRKPKGRTLSKKNISFHFIPSSS